MITKFRKHIYDEDGFTLLGIIITILLVMIILSIAIPFALLGFLKGGEVPLTHKGLHRLPDAGKIGGVCSGLAYYTETPVVLWRIGFVVGAFTVLPGPLLYAVLWIFLPYANGIPADYNEKCV
ncbi:MAG TPA: PspC domain-containing protein [archaeon]|nr:PspC domain-containing protein [archaeon]